MSLRIGIDARNLVPSLSGIGRYVIEMARALAEAGHRPVLYLPERPQQMWPDFPSSTVRISNFQGPWRRVLWGATALPRLASEDGLDVFWGPSHRLPNGIDREIPTVVTIHDLVWRKASRTMRWQTWLGERAFMRSALNRANAIVADSKATATDIEEFLPSVGHRVNVIYPGLTRLAPLDMATVRPFGRYALFVGTLEPRKNLKRILEAFSSLPPGTLANLSLVIAGGHGWRMSDLSDLILQLGLREKVILEGHISNSRLAALYVSAEFLLMPSLYEGFGFPIIEAQSFGIPVITSNLSSMPEVAGDGAILVNPTSVEEIRNAIQALATQPDLKAQLGIKARQNAERFTWQQSADQLITIFQRLQAK